MQIWCRLSGSVWIRGKPVYRRYSRMYVETSRSAMANTPYKRSLDGIWNGCFPNESQTSFGCSNLLLQGHFQCSSPYQSLTLWRPMQKVKVKLSLCLIKHHEGTLGSGSSPLLTSALDGSGQLHATAALHPGKEPSLLNLCEAWWSTRYSIYVRLGDPRSRSGRCGEENISCPAQIHTPDIHPVVRRYTD
jgi:hypothetical protein